MKAKKIFWGCISCNEGTHEYWEENKVKNEHGEDVTKHIRKRHKMTIEFETEPVPMVGEVIPFKYCPRGCGKTLVRISKSY